VRQLHTDLTTGPVAQARHVVGAAMESPARTETPELAEHEAEAMFTVLWCFERIDVARDSMLGRWHWMPVWINPRRALDDSVRIHAKIYHDYIHRATINGVPVRNGLTAYGDDAGLPRLAKQLGLAAHPVDRE
jgi:hypothetical protein